MSVVESDTPRPGQWSAPDAATATLVPEASAVRCNPSLPTATYQRPMNFKSLRAFQLVAERGSLSAAAGDLCLSQPAVSRLIAQLESELSLRLFDRSGRRLAMTREGKLFYDTTKHILAGLDEIPRIAKDIRTGNRQIQLLTTPRIAQAVVSPALAMLHRKRMQLRCRVEVVPRSELDNAVGTRHFDLAIASFPLQNKTPALEFKPLFKVRVEAVVPKSHRLAHRDVLTPADLASEDLIGPMQDHFWRQDMNDFFSGEADAPKCIVETPSSLMAFQMATNGAGIAFLDRLSARGLDASGIVFIPLAPANWTTFGYAHQRGETLNANSNDFVAAILDTIDSIRSTNSEMAKCIEVAQDSRCFEK